MFLVRHPSVGVVVFLNGGKIKEGPKKSIKTKIWRNIRKTFVLNKYPNFMELKFFFQKI
jgi:hypothetical protein